MKKKTAALRKTGFRALYFYAVGLGLAVLWAVFFSLDPIKEKAPALLDLIPAAKADRLDDYMQATETQEREAEETRRTLSLQYIPAVRAAFTACKSAATPDSCQIFIADDVADKDFLPDFKRNIFDPFYTPERARDYQAMMKAWEGHTGRSFVLDHPVMQSYTGYQRIQAGGMLYIDQSLTDATLTPGQCAYSNGRGPCSAQIVLIFYNIRAFGERVAEMLTNHLEKSGHTAQAAFLKGQKTETLENGVCRDFYTGAIVECSQARTAPAQQAANPSEYVPHYAPPAKAAEPVNEGLKTPPDALQKNPAPVQAAIPIVQNAPDNTQGLDAVRFFSQGLAFVALIFLAATAPRYGLVSLPHKTLWVRSLATFSSIVLVLIYLLSFVKWSGEVVKFVFWAGFLLVLFLSNGKSPPSRKTLIILSVIFGGGALLVLADEESRKNLASFFGPHVENPLTYGLFYPDVFKTFVMPLLLLFGPVAGLAIKEYFKEHPTYRRWFVIGKGGSSRWGGVREFIRRDFGDFIAHNQHGAYGAGMAAPIYLGRTLFEQDVKLGGRDIGLDTDSMMLTCGMIGSGKSRDVLHNNLMTWPGGAFILDPKGEHVQRTYLRRTRCNRKAYVIDPFGLCGPAVKTSHFNPLAEIDPADIRAREQIQEICEACLPMPARSSGHDEHFRISGQNILRGIIAHVLTAYPLEQRHLGTVYDIVTAGAPGEKVYDPKAFAALLMAMRENTAIAGSPMQAVNILDKAADRERGSLMTTIFKAIDWMNAAAIRPLLEKSDFQMRQIKAERVTVYLVIHTLDFPKYAGFLRTIITQMLWSSVLTHQPEGSRERVLVVLDEFAQLGTFKPIKEGLVTLRSAGLKIWLFVQNIQQLKERYDNWADFISSCDQQYFGVNDNDTAKHISEMLGKYVESWREGKEGESRHAEESRDLFTASEVREALAKDSPHQIVFVDGKPLLLNKRPYYKNFRADQYGNVRETKRD